MNRQQSYREIYRGLNPRWRDSLEIYKEIIAGMAEPGISILDIGCRHADLFKDIYAKAGSVYGVDRDQETLERNDAIEHKVLADADDLPFAENSFDLVAASWVLERLKHPRETFVEIFRVLKPGGKFVFLTPNALNYNVWLIRVTPVELREFFAGRFCGRREGDIYPVKYKANTQRKIRKMIAMSGMKEEKILFNGDPSYLCFNSSMFKIACLVEDAFNDFNLDFLKVHIIGVCKK